METTETLALLLQTTPEANILELLEFLTLPILAWNVWLHNNVISNRLKIAVNEAKDETEAQAVVKLNEKLDEVLRIVHQLEVDYAKDSN